MKTKYKREENSPFHPVREQKSQGYRIRVKAGCFAIYNVPSIK